MILIISEELDASTNEVIRWLRFLNKPYVRINEYDHIDLEGMTISNGKHEVLFKINAGPTISTNEISSCWYRRGRLQFNQSALDNISLEDSYVETTIKSNICRDYERLLDFLVFSIEQKNCINSIKTAHNNKLIHLQCASVHGLKIPATKVITNPSETTLAGQSFITKAISDGTHLKMGNSYFALYTNEISDALLKAQSERILPTLVQENIPKKWEIRSFYLEGQFYSMAIFSQKDNQTKLDFRRYNHKQPNQSSPYKLPKEIEVKIDGFMKDIGLNSGSIDLILGADDEYYFLEVNPVGQFGMVSFPCNYNLEKNIALSL